MLTRLNNLNAKILAGMGSLILLVGIALVIIVETTVQGKLHQALEKRGAFIAQEIAIEAATPLLTDHLVSLELLFKDIMEMDREIVYIFVQDPAGKVRAHSFGRTFPTDLMGLGTVTTGSGYRTQHFETEQGLVLDFTAPVLQGKLGMIHVGITEAPLRQEVNAILMQLILLILLVLLLGVGIAVLITRAITRPIKELVRATREVAGGNYAVAIDIHSADEIGVLAGSFRNMLDKRQEAIAALQASQKKLADIAASLGEGVLVIDASGKLTFMNPEAERLLGWTSGELVGQNLHARTHHHRSDGTPYPLEECPSTEVLRTGVRQVVERDMFLCSDGSFLSVSYVTAPIFEGDRVVAAVIAFQDITLRQMIEEERERLIGQLKEALDNVKKLEGMLPICSSCKRIRDDKGGWTQMEVYIHEHSEAEFSHGLCPDCAHKIYPKYFPK